MQKQTQARTGNEVWDRRGADDAGEPVAGWIRMPKKNLENFCEWGRNERAVYLLLGIKLIVR